MLTANQLRQAANQAKRDITHVEIDVLLTHILEMFVENGLTNDLAFKGGTMLRKMIFGPQGRLSTDLDFTHRSARNFDDVMSDLVTMLQKDYRGITFRLGNHDWYLIEDGGSANPVCLHADNANGIKIKIQISRRENPILAVQDLPQIQQVYFRNLGFAPSPIPCLAFEEIVAEKIRAGSQRAKIRDLYDLSEISARTFAQDLIRALATIKIWQTMGPGLNFQRFREMISQHDAYEVEVLDTLIAKERRPELQDMVNRVTTRFAFLDVLTDQEKVLAADSYRHQMEMAQKMELGLTESVVTRRSHRYVPMNVIADRRDS